MKTFKSKELIQLEYDKQAKISHNEAAIISMGVIIVLTKNDVENIYKKLFGVKTDENI